MTPPTVSVLHGEPTDTELAALIAAVAVQAAAADPTSATDETAAASSWDDRRLVLTGQPSRGPLAWRRAVGF